MNPKNKKIKIKFKRGQSYEISAKIIAEDRAKYFAVIDGYEDDSQQFLDEVDLGISDELKLFEWLENNMHWRDLKLYAESIEEDIFDIEDDWEIEDKEIIKN